jgi:hypothetical protein
MILIDVKKSSERWIRSHQNKDTQLINCPCDMAENGNVFQLTFEYTENLM